MAVDAIAGHEQISAWAGSVDGDDQVGDACTCVVHAGCTFVHAGCTVDDD